MKRLAIGDIHLSGFQTDKLCDDNLPERLSAIMKSLAVVASTARSKNITEIDILGDINNDKSIIYTLALSTFTNYLLDNQDLHFTMISGNHDMSSTGNNQKSSLEAFSGLPNVTTYAYEPAVKGNITYVPWTNDFMDTLSKLEKTDILISHLGLNEAMMQSGISKVDKMRMSDLKGWKLVLLGHYHKPQYLTNNETRVYYTGSLAQRDWNDKNEQKRILLYDTETLEVESIDIVGLKSFKEFIITEGQNAEEVLKQAREAMQAGDNVRVNNKSGQKLEDIGDMLVIDHTEVDVTNRGINVLQTREEQLRKYMEIKEIPENERNDYMAILDKYSII